MKELIVYNSDSTVWIRLAVNSDSESITLTIRGASKIDNKSEIKFSIEDAMILATVLTAEAEKVKREFNLGRNGIRDPNAPCTQFYLGHGKSNADCVGDGHYLCKNCAHYKPDPNSKWHIPVDKKE